jgi:hypothetical protein
VYPFGSMDYAVIFGSLMSIKAHQSWSHGWFLFISNLVLISGLIISVMIIKECIELNKILMRFSFAKNLCSNSCHDHIFSEPYSHGLHLFMPSEFSLVTFGNGIMTNDWWCRDEIESLLWCTHGGAARHALVSRLIVVIHCETIPMCCLSWTFF